MPSADQVPVKSAHSRMLWPMWVVLIAGSTGAALVLFALPTITSHRVSGGISSRSRREGGGFMVTFVPCHHRPSHPGEFVGEPNGCDLSGAPGQQSSEPGPMTGAMDLGIADHGERASREQTAQVAIALLADTAKLVFAPDRVLLRHKPNPGREVSSRSGLGVGNAGDQSCGQRRPDARDCVQSFARRA